MNTRILPRIISSLLLISTTSLWARKEYPASPFEVVALNSPVKEKEARFLLKLPKDFSVSKISIGIAGRKTPKQKPSYKKIEPVSTPQGPELRIPVSGWKTGSYRLYVKVKDKTQKEIDFQKKYRDYAAFGVINGLEPVKKPDPKANNLTLLGIDDNDNGIRDDVEIWINEKYGKDPEVLRFLHMKQLAQKMAHPFTLLMD